MATFIIKKSHSGNVLEPTDSQSENIISKWKAGNSYTLEYKRARSPKFHRLVFGIANIVCENSDQWSNPLLFIKAVELSHGYTDTFMDCNGEVFQVPKSISFANMKEDEFKILFDFILLEATRILNISREELLSAVDELLK
jgi:hypothetical protein